MSKSLKFLFIFMIFTTASFANVSKMATEFLSTNKDVLKLKSSLTLSELDVAAVEATMSWTSYYNYTRDDSSLESSSLLASKTLTETHSLGFARPNFYGGTISLENAYTLLDQKELNASVYGVTERKIYDFNQSLTYTQKIGKNFFGRRDRLSLNIAKKGSELTERKVKDSIQLALLGFYKTYQNVSLMRSLLLLQEEALERAKKRKTLIARRVRDGLREKVDLYQAEMAELQQIEALEGVKIDLKEAKEKLGMLLHRTVEGSEVTPIDLNNVDIFPVFGGSWRDNLEIQSKVTEVDIIQKNLKKARYAYVPEMELSAKYKTNDYDPKSSEALNNGTLGGKNDEVVLSFNLQWPIGFNSEEVAVEKERVNLRVGEIEKLKMISNFNEQENSLRTRIEKLDTNIKTAKERRILAQKVLKEYNKLYNISKADLDQVIRSEEDLILTEKTMVSYIVTRKMLFGELASLYGKFEKVILSR